MSLSLGKVLISSSRLLGSMPDRSFDAGGPGIVVAVTADIHQQDLVSVFGSQPRGPVLPPALAALPGTQHVLR